MTTPTLPTPAPATPPNKKTSWGCWAVIGVVAAIALVLLAQDLLGGTSPSLPVWMLIWLTIITIGWLLISYNPMRKTALPAPWQRVADPTTLPHDLRTIPVAADAGEFQNVCVANLDGQAAYLFDAVTNEIEDTWFAVQVPAGQAWHTVEKSLPSGPIRTVEGQAPDAVRSLLLAPAAFPEEEVQCKNGWLWTKPSFLTGTDVKQFLTTEAPKVQRIAAAAASQR